MPGTRPADDFWAGFRRMMPLWLGVVPFGLAYAITARGAGLSPLQTQSLSVFVFAGSAQVSAVGLFASGAAGITIVLTTLLLNARHALYGLSLARRLRLSRAQRPVAAFFLTDEAFGVVAASTRQTFWLLLGAELSLFATWNLSTLVGAIAAGAIPDPQRLGLDFVFPLAFLALLVPLVRGRLELAVAVVSGVVAYVISTHASSGVAILVTGVAGSLLGAFLSRGTKIDVDRDLDDMAREVA